VQSPDLFRGCDVRPLLPCARRRPAGAGIAGNDAVMHGVAEELRESSVEGVDVRVGPPLSLELGGPATDVRRLDRSHRHGAEVLLDELQVHLRLPHGGLAAGAVAVKPLVAPLPDCQPRHLRRNVVAANDGGHRLLEPFLGVDLPIEVARVLLSGILDVPSPPSGDLPRNGRRHLDRVAVLVLPTLTPAVLDGSALTTWPLPPARLARAHAQVVTHPSDYREAQRSQMTLWPSLLAWSSSQAKTSARQ
jgi:hypothetical protein